MSHRSRREFLANVGRGMLVASVGPAVALDMGFTPILADDGKDVLNFGDLEPLVALMQDTPADKLLPLLVERVKNGTDLRTLTAAGALANARTFGGEDYIGYHTFMALSPAYEMSRELPAALKPLPVLKVLHRNATRMQANGGRKNEVLHEIEPATDLPKNRDGGEVLQELVRNRDTVGAERAFAAMAKGPIGEAYQHLQFEVQDEVDVHRIVLSWRAWMSIDLVGAQHAHTLLRQSVRYCVYQEKRIHEQKGAPSAVRALLPKLFDQYKLLSKSFGTREADDAWLDKFSQIIYGPSREKAAEAVAGALAEGFSPETIGEALSIAANRLVLHDPGRRQAWPDKPIGSVHGDSVGVHASDSANAWRNIARVSNPRNTAASLIVGAFHTAGQSGGQNKLPYPDPEQLSAVTERDQAKLLDELDAAVRAKDQFRACAVTARYAETGAEVRPVFDRLIQFATSEDGALHAEKYYRTVSEEFSKTRPAFRWGHVVALARVTASEYGKTAPGYSQGKELLKV